MRPIILLLLLVPLAACSLFQSKQTRALHKSPDYHAGYQDGCSSAWGPDANKRHDDTIVRDDQQYKDNKAYRLGWDQGINACRASATQGGPGPGASPNTGPVPDVNPGNGGIPRGF